MLYQNGRDYLKSNKKSIALFGMSGLGKTRLSNMLRVEANWFHYSVDYRIGTRYMSEAITDNFKREAMKSPLLAQLLHSDSVYIASNITFENLSPLSTYLGKPGRPDKGGIPFHEYCRRQDEHRVAEINAMNDIGHFRNRAKDIYGYDHFVADCSGSLCEVLSDDIASCDIMAKLAENALPVWLEGDESHREKLIARFSEAPKPMYYRPDFLIKKWQEYQSLKKISSENVDPDDFAVWGYGELLMDRIPRYRAMAENWGIGLKIDEIERLNSADDFNQLIASKLG